MKILFAVPDRDLLAGYEALLNLAGHTVVTAFDGVQALSRAEEHVCDLAVLDETITRVDAIHIVEQWSLRRLPAVLLIGEALSVRRLTRPVQPASYLVYPFEPQELIARLPRVLEAATACPDFDLNGVTVQPGLFSLNGRVSVTWEEIGLLARLAGLEWPGEAPDVCMGSLNKKLQTLAAGFRLRRVPGQGYGMVTTHE